MNQPTATSLLSPAERAIADRVICSQPWAVVDGIQFNDSDEICIVDAEAFADTHGLPVTHERARAIVNSWPDKFVYALEESAQDWAEECRMELRLDSMGDY